MHELRFIAGLSTENTELEYLVDSKQEFFFYRKS